jgi:hypothetical protein
VGYKPATRIDGIFYELLVRFGWGMYGDSSALRISPPDDVSEFLDTLLIIDGRDPAFASRTHRQLLATLVKDWVLDPAGRGARSGLPLTEPT